MIIQVTTLDGFTKEQLANWRKYEKVRARGRFNMLDPRARVATGLERETYLFTLKNYSELRAAIFKECTK